jgi:AcrR family transcriptional regulator
MRDMQGSKRQDTKAALMRAAERLFAEKGLGGVSVRDITLAAGARNQSALHYHFGSMDELIREVFAHRYREIEAARCERIAEVEAKGAGGDIYALLQAAAGPMLESCQDERGRLYARFCVQLAMDPRFNLFEVLRETGMESALRMRELTRAVLTDLPEEILRTRLRRLAIILILMTADHASMVESGTAPPVELATREAAATLAGFLLAGSPTGTPG